jgi:hypothetical protein
MNQSNKGFKLTRMNFQNIVHANLFNSFDSDT